MEEHDIRYPIGIQTFSEIIEEGYLYVDKTALMYELIHRIKYAFLSRPRRFGKSLLMSTMECYFKGRKELFRNLAIAGLETKWECYPVFRIDLSSGYFKDHEGLERHVSLCLDEIEEDYGLQAEGELYIRFRKLIRQAYKKYGKKIVVLIDEYDKPMLENLHENKRLEDTKDKLRSFYSVLKASDEYIRFAMITGVSKFSQVSIFSGFNNLKDISMIPKYSSICGISESEFRIDFAASIRKFAESHGIDPDTAWMMFKENYDGYHFSIDSEGIYNPFSVLNAFEAGTIRSYWFSTGSSDYLVKLIDSTNFSLSALVDARRKESALSDITSPTGDVVPLLYQAGYLTLKGYNPETQEYLLDFPNREVRQAFWESLANHFFLVNSNTGAFDQKRFIQEVVEGKPEPFMQRLQYLLADTPSPSEVNKEIHFQNMMRVIGKMLGLMVHTEVESSAGRCDMQILTQDYVYIFEFKINSTSKEALAQIEERGYARPYLADDRITYLIGANFSTKTRTLTDWLVETLK